MCLHFHLTRDIRYLTSSATALVGELDGLGGSVGSVGLGGLDEPGGPGIQVGQMDSGRFKPWLHRIPKELACNRSWFFNCFRI